MSQHVRGYFLAVSMYTITWHCIVVLPGTSRGLAERVPEARLVSPTRAQVESLSGLVLLIMSSAHIA